MKQCLKLLPLGTIKGVEANQFEHTMIPGLFFVVMFCLRLSEAGLPNVGQGHARVLATAVGLRPRLAISNHSTDQAFFDIFLGLRWTSSSLETSILQLAFSTLGGLLRLSSPLNSSVEFLNGGLACGVHAPARKV